MDEVDATLLHGFHDLYKKLVAQADSGELSSEGLLELSGSFLSFFKDNCDNERVASMYKNWHLAEIFFIRGDEISKSGGFILSHLLQWVATHFTEAESLRLEALSQGSNYEEHPLYWPAVLRLACQGRMKDVSMMLQLHASYPQDELIKTPIKTLEELARRMPVFHAGASITEFTNRWQLWKKHVAERTASVTEPSLSLLARLFQGDEAAFEELGSEEFHMCWEEIVVAKILYTDPLLGIVNVGQAVEDYAAKEQSWDSRPHHAHNLILHIVHHQPIQTLATATEYYGSHLFSSHLSYFLHQCNWLSETEMSHPQELTLALGEEISAAYPHLYSLAATYLAGCGERGADILHTTLTKVPLPTANVASKVLSTCKSLGMLRTGDHICRSYAANLAGQARISWLLKGHDYNTITSEVDDMLEAYRDAGKSDQFDVVKPFQEAMQCERLAFAAAYKHMLDLRASGNYADASSIIMQLLTATTLAPKWFWVQMLKDALPLLENDKILFSAEETRALLQCLEEVMVSHCFDVEEDEVADVRMALARNLARTIILNKR